MRRKDPQAGLARLALLGEPLSSALSHPHALSNSSMNPLKGGRDEAQT